MSERPLPTEIRIDERGDETHESWILVGASKVSGSTHLFDSELEHRHFVSVRISRCVRKRDLHRDWLFAKDQIVEFDMSMAQWGAFVSSFGDGSGVPATLTWLSNHEADDPRVPAAPHAPRLKVSADEVQASAEEALDKMQTATDALVEAFERNAGRKEMRSLIEDVSHHVRQAPGNMRFASDSLTKHVENVVTKAKADIEAAVQQAARQGMEIDPGVTFEIGAGEQGEVIDAEITAES